MKPKMKPKMKSAMKGAIAIVVVAAGLAGLAGAGCTLLLPTDQLITPCTNNADCDKAKGKGFVCQENACLPADTGEGEGEGAAQ